MTLMGLSAAIYGQYVYIDNTSGGGLVLGLRPNDQLNVTLMGGPVGGSLVPVVTLTGCIGDGCGIGGLLNLGNGLVYDSNGWPYAIPGVGANATASLQLQFWVGSSSTFAEAVAGGYGAAASPVYSNPTGGADIPPLFNWVSAMANMPNVFVGELIPEPSTLALAGLGAAVLVMYRRRVA